MNTRLASTLSVSALMLALSSTALAGSITTLFASNNNGTAGGMNYFDVTVGATGLTITGFDVNTNTTAPFGFQVYIIAGTYVGNTGNSGLWTLAATGTGTNTAQDTANPVVLDNTFNLAANTTYGMAVSLSGGAGAAPLYYTNGTGTNQAYSNADISLALGAASNTQWGALFTPRVWNGTIRYTPVPEPATIAILGVGGLAAIRRRRRK